MSDRMERKGEKNKVARAVLITLVALAVLGLIYRIGCQAVTAIQERNRDIKIVQFGTMEDRLSAAAVVLNQEEIFPAKEAGRFENLVKEKEKVSKGALLGYFITAEAKSTVRASKAGVFIRSTDGLEEVFAQLNLAEVTPEVFKYKPHASFLERPFQAGEPMYKIVDSLVPTRLLLSLPIDEVDFIVQPEQKIRVVDENQESKTGRIVEMKQQDDDLLMLVQLDSFYENTVNKRYLAIDIVFDSQTGFLVPIRAIVEKEGKKGVYCAVGEFTKFKAVEIVKQKDDTALVRGLDKNDFIVTNPPARI